MAMRHFNFMQSHHIKLIQNRNYVLWIFQVLFITIFFYVCLFMLLFFFLTFQWMPALFLITILALVSIQIFSNNFIIRSYDLFYLCSALRSSDRWFTVSLFYTITIKTPIWVFVLLCKTAELRYCWQLDGGQNWDTNQEVILVSLQIVFTQINLKQQWWTKILSYWFEELNTEGTFRDSSELSV